MVKLAEDPSHTWRVSPRALWGYGFRPFFLAAALAAVLLVPWWATSFVWGMPLGTHWPGSLWHAHEMLFGFIVAAIAGFLLTAVPSWTGARGFAGWPLASLATLWALGRVVVSTSAVWPLSLVAALDLAFLPALAAFVLPPLVRARNRNTPLLAVLLILWATNAAFYFGLSRANAALARHALLLAIDVVLLLVTVIGGRIVPAFTTAALKQARIAHSVRAWPGVTPLAIGAMVLVVLVDGAWLGSRAAGAIALIAALIQIVRLLQWQGLRTARLPIVWVLHLAYLWLPVGLALKALSLLGGFAFAAFYVHALTIGAAATMILAVMSRASLGHTGRPLVVSRVTTIGYGLITAAVLTRVFGPGQLSWNYSAVILLAAACWAAAWALFLWVYAPILLSPRADGKPG